MHQRILLTAHEAIMRPFGIIFELQVNTETPIARNKPSRPIFQIFVELQFMKKKNLPV